MNLLLLEPGSVDEEGLVHVSGDAVRHLRTILKVAPGHDVRVGILDGPRGIGRVLAVDEGRIELRCTFEASTPERPRVDLLLALPRPKVLKRLWAQLAALGVGRIVLTNASRVERNYFDTHVLAPGTYRPLLIEGLQQARDTRLPPVTIHRQFRVLIEDELDAMFPSGIRLVAHPGQPPLAGLTPPTDTERLLLAVGPEGGWNAFELKLLDAHGFQPVGMGERTLRTDTACIALLTLVHERLRRDQRRPAAG